MKLAVPCVLPVTMPVNVGNETRVLLVPRRGSGYAKVGVVAEDQAWIFALGVAWLSHFHPLGSVVGKASAPSAPLSLR
jgi:hypothetical protein